MKIRDESNKKKINWVLLYIQRRVAKIWREN